MTITQTEGMSFLGGLVADLDDKLAEHSNGLGFAGVFWNIGKPEDPLSLAIFAHPDRQREAAYAARTVGAVTQAVAFGQVTGQDLHGLDTPDRVCFYEQDFYVLSNFSAFSLTWEGFRFDTLEAAYHWEKFVGYAPGVCESIRTAPSAHEAFRIAQEQREWRRQDWDDVKVDIMRRLLRAKADQHEYVRRKLLQTGDRELVENSWRDDFWGWGPNRDGQNMLGKLWMEIRTALRSEGVEP